jgi:hypothetical protein
MPLASMTCTVMFGSGARITGTATMKVLRSMGVHGLMKRLLSKHPTSCGAVAGTSLLGIAALPLASTLVRGGATSAMVFGLFVLRPGLPSPLLSCTLVTTRFLISERPPPNRARERVNQSQGLYRHCLRNNQCLKLDTPRRMRYCPKTSNLNLWLQTTLNSSHECQIQQCHPGHRF